ncbi:hypothetical protein AAFF_G00411730 [Aldrovandia affinis]|uniref:Uncharacterized protein n=1 Tax=Aldrovandia affinis TaxID=143900 RepID=A0AAD7WJM1_9TELE|nr:hypothetical protein AAFF_G00411730 [Aldrovandia affinis]
MVVKQCQPFSVVQDEGVKAFVGKLDPTYILPSRNALKIMVEENYKSTKEKTEVPFRRRFNLKKAKWTEYSEGMERALLDVEPTPDNYTMFVQAVKKTACACIPRGCRKEYIAGLTEESLQLLESYETEFGNDPFSDTTSELGDALTESLGRRGGKPGKTL